ncbi:chromate transporter [Enhydrobacter aerosaccus]|uniref:Chromate transporter n=1 Tax=Enhydrobacter aerosaccus TaxID=225324 RepID=A0A1T4T252_9HYPH|nr:chromate transporter [Enhydrobacter aerosaccus]SKA34321.1 chromate transporter [Enhydrobacter aerosaccus]
MALSDSDERRFDSPTAPTDAPTVGELFRGFLMMGLMGFGGVLPLSRHIIVDERRWLSGKEFTELLGLCQFLPGGNVINVAAALGLHFRGVPGALAALAGLIAAPTAIVVVLGAIYARFQSDPHVVHMFAGLAAAAAGLLVSMAVKLALPLRKKPVAIAFAVICFAAIAVFHFPLLPTMLVLAPLSIAAIRKTGT